MGSKQRVGPMKRCLNMIRGEREEEEKLARLAKRHRSDSSPATLGDNFSRLSEDLMILILSKLNDDLKDLFVCSLVCSHFASMVTQIQIVRLTCPVRSFFAIYRCTNGVRSISGLLTGTPKLSFIPFLEKFRNLNSIDLGFTCPVNNSLAANWKAKCEKKRGIIDTFVCQLLEKVTQFSRENQNEEDTSRLGTIDYGIQVFVACFNCVHLVYILVQRLRSLRRVTIIDSVSQGKLILEQEQLVSLRNSLARKCRWLDLDLHIHAVPQMQGLLLKIKVESQGLGERAITYEWGF